MTDKLTIIFIIAMILLGLSVVVYTINDQLTETSIPILYPPGIKYVEYTSPPNVSCETLVGLSDTVGNSAGGRAICKPIPTETTTSWNATVQPFFDENDTENYTIEPYSPIIYAGGGAGINESTTTEAYYYTVGGGGGGSSYTSIEYPLQVYPQNLIGG